LTDPAPDHDASFAANRAICNLDRKVGFLVEDGEGQWRLPPDAGGDLLMFSVLATKPVEAPQ
jgi:hypothetical protein